MADMVKAAQPLESSMNRIPTHRNIVRRAGARLWQACDDHQWLPLVIVLVLLLIVNSVDAPF
jgi:hypothetical protein